MQEQAKTICTTQNQVTSNINIKCVLTFMGFKDPEISMYSQCGFYWGYRSHMLL